MKNRFWICYFSVLASLIILAAVYGPELARRDAARIHARLQAAYSAWCKFNSRTDITFEEWNAMRDLKVLPNQPK